MGPLLATLAIVCALSATTGLARADTLTVEESARLANSETIIRPHPDSFEPRCEEQWNAHAIYLLHVNRIYRHESQRVESTKL